MGCFLRPRYRVDPRAATVCAPRSHPGYPRHQERQHSLHAGKARHAPCDRGTAAPFSHTRNQACARMARHFQPFRPIGETVCCAGLIQGHCVASVRGMSSFTGRPSQDEPRPLLAANAVYAVVAKHKGLREDDRRVAGVRAAFRAMPVPRGSVAPSAPTPDAA